MIRPGAWMSRSPLCKQCSLHTSSRSHIDIEHQIPDTMKQALFAAFLFHLRLAQVNGLAPSGNRARKCFHGDLETTGNQPAALMSRRTTFGLASSLAALLGVTESDCALAFANKISTKYDDRPKRRGPQVSCPSSQDHS